MKKPKNKPPAQPRVACSHTAVWPIGKFRPHPKNPNTHPKEQLALLGKIIAAQGWRSPICVSKRSGLVVKGHGRLAAAKLAGFKSAPVDLQTYASEAEELADLIADNRLAELSEIDVGALKDLMQELDTGALDMELTGFGEEALEKLMSQVHPGDGPNPELGEKWEVAIECAGEQEQLALLERFKTEGLKCRALTF